MSIIQPDGLTLMQWTDYTGDGLTAYGPVPRLEDETRWQDWGATVLGMGTLRDTMFPNPYNFTDWREWADRFNQVLDSQLSG